MTKLASLLTRVALIVASALVATSSARADVADVSQTGFQIKITAQIAATPDKIYATIIQPSKWWNSSHTFSGSASNLKLDATAGGCFCETLADGGSVEHLTVISAMPGKSLRMRGALGPFQGFGLAGALTWALAPGQGQTTLTLTYDLGGHMPGGFGDLPKAADGMLTEQVARLKKFIETGTP